MGGGLVGVGGKRLSGSALVADWSYDMLRVKRLRLESLVKGDGEIGLEEEEERGRRRREERRKEREELKEQLEEARGRLKTLQEKVWKAFGERPAQEERKKRGGREEDGDGGMDEEEEEEETAEGITEEEEGGEIDDLPLSFIPPSPPFYSVAKRDRKARDHEKPTGEDKRNVNGGGGVFLEGGGVGGFGGGGGSQKFAQALKQELGSAVARVIDRVLRLYTQNQPLPPSRRGRVGATHDQQPPAKRRPPPHAFREQSEALPLVTRRPDNRRTTLLPSNNRTHNPLLPSHPLPPLRQPHPHPAFLPPVSRHKDSSPFLPPSSCPLPLPLLHYTMQQLFTRSLSHLPPLHKGNVMNSDAYMEGNPFPPHAHPILLSSLLPSSLPCSDGRIGVCVIVLLHTCVCVCVSLDYSLTNGYSQEGLSPCHLKKAKLMFFYARYPSSNTLKTYFPDVKFNRCVTSQLIKWFSNFREFFYIQMERFARQAARD
ncbi:unnamed protein product, partial [Oncorhynchus mykiss]